MVDLAKTLPAHDRGEVGGVRECGWPFGKEYRHHSFNPGSAGFGNRATLFSQSLPKGETLFRMLYAIDPSLIAIRERYLGKPGINIKERSADGQIVFIAPFPDRRCSEHE